MVAACGPEGRPRDERTDESRRSGGARRVRFSRSDRIVQQQPPDTRVPNNGANMKRLSVVLVLGGLASVLTPTTASAQPYPAFLPPIYAPVPYIPPRQYSYGYQYNSSINVPLYIGNVSINRSYY